MSASRSASRPRAILSLACLLASLHSLDARAQILISANDGKAQLVDGVNTTVPKGPPDTVTIVDLGSSPPKIVATVAAPSSVVGPPQNVAMTPDRAIVLVASSTRIDPADSTKTAPDDTLTVIDLQARPPVVLAKLRAGRGASGVAINSKGTLALVANRYEGSVSVFAIAGKTVTPDGTVSLGAPDSQPSGVAITPDGRTALVTRNNDNLISILSIDGGKVDYNQRTIEAGLKPYGIEITPSGTVAVVGNIGAGPSGAPDTVSLIDLAASTPRAVNHVTVGPTAEGLALSPDGKFVAVTVMNGSNSPKNAPTFHDFGLLRVFSLSNTTMAPVTDAKIGHWCQGVAWQGSQRLFVQCMVEREIQTFGFDGRTLTPGAAITVNGGPAGIQISR